MRATALALLTAVALTSAPHAQTPAEPDWKAVEAETLRHFQALVQFDTSDPPGNEKPAADYLKSVLEREGLAVEIYAREPNRPNVVARIKGNGRKRPLLIMGHTDVVNVDPKKWTHPPFGAVRDGGHIYGRGTVDDKDNVTAALMVMLLLKRANVPLDRDVIFLAESGEEGTTRVGIELMTNQHFAAIDAEFCYGEGGGVTRQAGQVRYASVQTVEKIPRGIDLISRGISGHGSVPLTTNAVAHLAGAVARVAAWRPPITLNDTTAAYFKRLAALSPPEVAKHYRDVMSLDPKISEPADTWLLQNEPRHASMLRTSVSPNIIQGGYRNNVIPSEARATLDVRFTARRGPEAVPGAGQEGGERSGRGGGVQRVAGGRKRYAARRYVPAGYRCLQGARSGRDEALRHRHAADDEHRRHGYVVPARQGRPVLRRRTGRRHGGRSQGLWRAQRPGTHP